MQKLKMNKLNKAHFKNYNTLEAQCTHSYMGGVLQPGWQLGLIGADQGQPPVGRDCGRLAGQRMLAVGGH